MKPFRGRRSRGAGKAPSTRESLVPYSRRTTTPVSMESGHRSNSSTSVGMPLSLASTSSSSKQRLSKHTILSEHSVVEPVTTIGLNSLNLPDISNAFSHTQGSCVSSHCTTFSNNRQTVSNTHDPNASNTPTLSREAGLSLCENIDGKASSVQSPHSHIIEDDENEVVMALDIRTNSTLGCAYYVAREEKLYCMQDCNMADRTMIETCGFIEKALFHHRSKS